MVMVSLYFSSSRRPVPAPYRDRGLRHALPGSAPLPEAMSETVSDPGFTIGGKQAIFTTETERGTQRATEKHSRIHRSDRPERP